MKLIFRYDDYCGSPKKPFEIDRAIINLFVSREIPMVIGVVPLMSKDVYNYNNTEYYSLRDDEKRIKLLNYALENNFQVSLHGLTHQRTREIIRTEFKSLSYNVQYDKILQGIKILTETFPDNKVEVFIPPWNSFDHITVKSVQNVGLEVISCGWNYINGIKNGLNFAPAFISIVEFVKYIQRYSLEDLNKIFGNSNIVIIMHEYEFSFNGGNNTVSFKEFGNILDIVQKYGIKITTINKEDDTNIYIPRYMEMFNQRIQTIRNSPYKSKNIKWMKYIHPGILNNYLIIRNKLNKFRRKMH